MGAMSARLFAALPTLLMVHCHGAASNDPSRDRGGPSDLADAADLGDGSDPGDPSEPGNMGGPAPRETGSTRDRVTFFVSGHSLTDDPLADFVVQIAGSHGLAAEYNQQIIVGSPIRVRTRGYAAAGWSGYREGKNRAGGTGLDVVAELRSPRTVSRPYDALVLTERHDLMSVLEWEDTVRFARHLHDRLEEGNPSSTTYLYSAWLGLRNLDDPAAWIRYERAASPVWECVASRIQTSLDAEGRSSRVTTIPIGGALAELVERALAGRVRSLAASSTRGTLRRIFSDDVHLTTEGAYFAAAFVFSHLFGRTPQGATAPREVNPELAGELEAIAWELAQRSLASGARPTLPACRAMMRDTFCREFWTYTGQPSQVSGCQSLFDESNRQGPFFFDPGSDAGYWFPAP